MTLTHTTHYPRVFLTCIHADSNNYKFYEMEDSWRQIIAHKNHKRSNAPLWGGFTSSLIFDVVLDGCLGNLPN